MCLAAVIPPSAKISRFQLHNGWEKNQHGSGVAWVEDKTVLVRKFLHGFKKPYNCVLEARRRAPDSHILVHFRSASVGLISVDNCHPFLVGEGDNLTAVVHNGTISHLNTKGQEESDTRRFCNEIIGNLPKGWWNNPVMVELVESYIDRSKVAFLSSSEVFIANKHLWKKDDNTECIYSNEQYVSPPDRKKKKDTAEYSTDYGLASDVPWFRGASWSDITTKTPAELATPGPIGRCEVCNVGIVKGAIYVQVFRYAAEKLYEKMGLIGGSSSSARCCHMCAAMDTATRSNVIIGKFRIYEVRSCESCNKDYYSTATTEMDASFYTASMMACPRCKRSGKFERLFRAPGADATTATFQEGPDSPEKPDAEGDIEPTNCTWCQEDCSLNDGDFMCYSSHGLCISCLMRVNELKRSGAEFPEGTEGSGMGVLVSVH